MTLIIGYDVQVLAANRIMILECAGDRLVDESHNGAKYSQGKFYFEHAL